MIELSSVLGWAAFGFAAAVCAMLMPYRRGWSGLAMNVLAGVVGAVAFGFLGLGVHLYDRSSAPLAFIWSTGGAVASLLLVHGLWSRFARQRQRVR